MLCICCGKEAFCQRDIVYLFDRSVNDSILVGIREYSKKLGTSEQKLHLAIFMDESNGVYDIYLQEYSFMKSSGILNIIKNSNRKLKVENLFIPVFFSCDNLSQSIRKDNIAYLPYSGYYLRVLTENGRQSVIEVKDLF